MVVLAFVALCFWSWPRRPPGPEPLFLDTSRYGFESLPVPWVRQAYGTGKGTVAVARSADVARLGRYSLKLAMDLARAERNKSEGEAYVDMRSFPPVGVKAPIDLEGVPVTAWIYVPRGAAGHRRRPNGVQLFVKDENWKGQYGTWLNLRGRTERWFQICLTPSARTPNLGYTDMGFDPTKIMVIGVKVGAGTASTAKYRGPIYMDAVNW